jgi:hypothetical protein
MRLAGFCLYLRDSIGLQAQQLVRHRSGGRKAMKEPGLDHRHRDKNGEISRKHGNTLVRTLRKLYGAGFAPGCSDEDKLSDVRRSIAEPTSPRSRWTAA